jgi:hypothetical protein
MVLPETSWRGGVRRVLRLTSRAKRLSCPVATQAEAVTGAVALTLALVVGLTVGVAIGEEVRLAVDHT